MVTNGLWSVWIASDCANAWRYENVLITHRFRYDSKYGWYVDDTLKQNNLQRFQINVVESELSYLIIFDDLLLSFLEQYGILFSSLRYIAVFIFQRYVVLIVFTYESCSCWAQRTYRRIGYETFVCIELHSYFAPHCSVEIAMKLWEKLVWIYPNMFWLVIRIFICHNLKYLHALRKLIFY